MNEAAHGVRGNQPQQPQDEHYYSNGIEHDVDFLYIVYAHSRAHLRESGATDAKMILMLLTDLVANNTTDHRAASHAYSGARAGSSP